MGETKLVAIAARASAEAAAEFLAKVEAKLTGELRDHVIVWADSATVADKSLVEQAIREIARLGKTGLVLVLRVNKARLPLALSVFEGLNVESSDSVDRLASALTSQVRS